MKIVSLIRRDGGTVVTLPQGKKKINYRFAPSANDERHTCEVADEEHAKCLLKIREGYRNADLPDDEDEEVATLGGTNNSGDLEDDGFNPVADTVVEIDGESIDLAKQTKVRLSNIMRKLEITEPLGNPNKDELVALILKTMDDRVLG
jgi:hypothetical protein